MADGATPQKSPMKSGQKLAHAAAQDSPLEPGRREFFKMPRARARSRPGRVVVPGEMGTVPCEPPAGMKA